MEAYSDFATVYDTFMDETPYDVWGDFVGGLIEKYGISKPYDNCAANGDYATGELIEGDGDACEGDANSGKKNLEEALDEERNLVVELGCGTGSFTQVMKKKGYDIMGIDMSPDMLNIARNKAAQANLDIMYLEQDMRELDLYCTAGTILSVCDSINYLLEDEDVLETFRLVNNFLFPKGIFIFDFNTLHKYRDVIGDATIAENREDCSFIWENFYHEDEHINEYDLTIFTKCDPEDEVYRKFNETHYQRGYTLQEVLALVEEAGLELVATIDADTHEEPSNDSERIYVVCRENGKEIVG